MPTPFIMPKMDMDQESVNINEWLKKEGDLVKKGEPVVVVETDKITSEVEAPATGRLVQILYGENEDVPVSEIVAYILAEGETEADLPGKAEPRSDSGVIHEERTLTTEDKSPAATAVARRMADAENIDLAQVPTSSGKISKQDVEAYLKSNQKVASRVQTPATPSARRIAAEESVDINTVKGSGPRGRVQAVDVETFTPTQPESVISQASAENTVTLSTMRKRIAERLTVSYQTTPHIYLTVEVDMSESEASRKRMNALAAKEETPEISLTAYLVRVVAWSLKRHPYLNASLIDGAIKFWSGIHIGIATALDEGLIVPVIHNADQQTARELNECLRNLTRRARNGELTKEEIQDGTFTISNLGMYGIQSFTSIINPPQSAILSVGTLKRRPMVVDNQDTIEVRPMMMLTLAADHRIVDGVVAADFLADIVKALETPELLLF